MAISQKKCLEILKANLLVLLVLLGAVIGFSIGIGIRSVNLSDSTLMWVGILGEVYMNMLRMMLVPLIMSTIITGTATLNPKSNGKIGLVCFGFIMVTNFMGAVLGVILCILINPGRITQTDIVRGRSTALETQDIFADLLRNLFPENLVSSTFQKRQTEYLTEGKLVNETINGTVHAIMKNIVITKQLTFVPSTNILGILIASTLFGVATSALKDVGKPFFDFFYSTSEIVLYILGKLIWFTPIGVGSLIAKTVGSTKNLEDDFSRLGLYIVTVVTGSFIFIFILAPVFYFILMRKNPFTFFFNLINSFVIVLATSMSVLALPENIRQLEGVYHVDKRVVRFSAPLCAATGRCGSVLNIAIACIFVMQFTDHDVEATHVVLVVILSTLSSVAIPSISSASLITVIILLTALHIPPEGAILLFTFDWLLDRIRTSANLSSHILCPVFIEKICESSIKDLDTDDTVQSHDAIKSHNGYVLKEGLNDEENTTDKNSLLEDFGEVKV